MSAVTPTKRLRFLTLIAVTAAFGCGLGYLSAYRDPPAFQSHARLFVVDSMTGSANSDTQLSHSEAVRSGITCVTAVADGHLAPLECLRSAADPVPALQARLAVLPLDEAESLLELRFAAARRTEPKQVLEAVIQAYRKLLGDTFLDDSAKSLQDIRRAQSEIHDQLTQREAAYAQWTAVTPDFWQGTENAALQRNRLTSLEKAYDEFVLQRKISQTRAAAITEARKRGDTDLIRTAVAPPDSPPRAASHPLTGQGTELDELQAEERALLRTLGENHPRVKNVRARIDAAIAGPGVETAETKLRAEESRLLQQFGPAHPRVREVRAKLGELQSPVPLNDVAPVPAMASLPPSADPAEHQRVAEDETRRLDSAIADLEAQLPKLREEVTRRNEWEKRDIQFRDEIDRLRRLFDATVTRLKYLQVRQGEPIKRLIVLQPPTEAELLTRDAWRPAGIGAGIGSLTGLLIVGLHVMLLQSVDTTTTTTTTTNTATATATVLARIPTVGLQIGTPSHTRKLGETLVVVRQPNNPQAEAFRNLRATLQFQAGPHGSVIFGFLAADLTEQHAMVVVNLAASLALAGSRVLVVDASCSGVGRRPWGLSSQASLNEALGGTVELVDAIATSDITHLHVCSWSHCKSTTLLPRDPTYDIEILKTKYDYVLILAAINDSVTMDTCQRLFESVVLFRRDLGSNDPRPTISMGETGVKAGPLLGVLLLENDDGSTRASSSGLETATFN